MIFYRYTYIHTDLRLKISKIFKICPHKFTIPFSLKTKQNKTLLIPLLTYFFPDIKLSFLLKKNYQDSDDLYPDSITID